MWTCLTATLAVSGLVTKMHLLGPLPLFGLVYVVAGQQMCPVDPASKWKARTMVGIVYGCVAAATLFLYSLLIDWSDYFAYWWGTGSSGLLEGLDPFRTALHVLVQALLGPGKIPLQLWMPGATKSGMSFLSELPIVTLGLAGGIACWMRHPQLRRRMGWCALYGVFTLLIWLFRSAQSRDFHGFHYLIIVMALASVFFGHASDRVLGRIGAFEARSRALGAMTAWLLILHPFAIWGTLDSRIQDIRSFSRYRPYFDALSRIGPKQRIAVLTGANVAWNADMLHGLSTVNGRRSLLIEEFRERFIAVDPKAAAESTIVMRLRAQGVAVVVDGAQEVAGAAVPIETWRGGAH